MTIRPTQIDKDLARAIARHTTPRIEQGAEALTWGADEHALIAAATIAWLLTRQSNEPLRRLTTHVLACSLAAAILPHIMKNVIDQERPDRLTVRGHWRGIPWSGNSKDAFPSGHALHVGALASAATLLPSKARDLVWAVGTVLVANSGRAAGPLAHRRIGRPWSWHRAGAHHAMADLADTAPPRASRPHARHGETVERFPLQ